MNEKPQTGFVSGIQIAAAAVNILFPASIIAGIVFLGIGITAIVFGIVMWGEINWVALGIVISGVGMAISGFVDYSGLPFLEESDAK